MDARKFIECLVEKSRIEFVFSSDPIIARLEEEADKVKRELTPDSQILILQMAERALKPLIPRQRASGYIALALFLGWPREFDPQKFPLLGEIWPLTVQWIRPANSEAAFAFFIEPFALYEKMIADLSTLSADQRRQSIQKIGNQIDQGLAFLKEHHPEIYPDEGLG